MMIGVRDRRRGTTSSLWVIAERSVFRSAGLHGLFRRFDPLHMQDPGLISSPAWADLSTADEEEVALTHWELALARRLDEHLRTPRSAEAA